jgi:hypothetical protein
MDAGPLSASGEVLRTLVMQWLTQRVVSAPETSPPALIVAGADEITRSHLERLADACELHGAPLTLLFRHLRDDAATLLGGGTAAFLRLGNHAEAARAAGYLGRHHTFVTSSHAASRSRSQTRVVGGGNGPSWARTDSVNWREQSVKQRVYEYRVEPSALQDLPEFTMLLADRTAKSLRLRAIEFDLSIASLPGVSADPLPPVSATRTGKAPWEPIGAAAEPPVAVGSGEDRCVFAEQPEPSADTEPEIPWWERKQPQ